MSRDKFINRLIDIIEDSESDKTGIAADAGIHVNTLYRVVNQGKGDLTTIFLILKALGYELTIRKKQNES